MSSCSACTRNTIVEDFNKGISFCSNCGKVTDFKSYTTRSEGFTNEGSSKENTERSGSPTNLIYNKNFLQNDFETRNLPLNLSQKVFFNKLRYWHRRISNTPLDNAEKSQNKTYTILTQVSSTMSFTRDFQKKILSVQETVSKNVDFSQVNLRNLLCAITFYLIRQDDLSYSFSQVVSGFNVTRKNVAKLYRELAKYLDGLKKNEVSKTVPQLIEEYCLLFPFLSQQDKTMVVNEGQEFYAAGQSLFSIKIPSKISRAILAQILNKKKLSSIKQSCKILGIPETTVIGTGSIKEIFKEYNLL